MDETGSGSCPGTDFGNGGYIYVSDVQQELVSSMWYADGQYSCSSLNRLFVDSMDTFYSFSQRRTNDIASPVGWSHLIYGVD